jgi:gamma-glutamylcyclotransferase (GGCT)/AIG2-like uncharacterized protein YtfP
VPAAVFVYGTLMPGHLRWALLAPFATTSRPARVAGVVHDTGRGWPAARFARPLVARPVTVDVTPAPDDAIEGWLVALDPATLDEALAVLDEVEGAVPDDGSGPIAPVGGVTDGGYRRILVRGLDGEEAWAYEALRIDPAWPRLAAWTDQPER